MLQIGQSGSIISWESSKCLSHCSHQQGERKNRSRGCQTFFPCTKLPIPELSITFVGESINKIRSIVLVTDCKGVSRSSLCRGPSNG